MRGRIVGSILLYLCALSWAQAQEFKVGKYPVQVHGFFSQGFAKSDTNNWLTMNTRQGSGAMTDMGLNLSSQLTDKFRLGGQVYEHNLGQLGQWHPALDWAVADYRFTNWFGVRAGKVKTTMGLYTDSQDLDFLRVFALLPQSVYPIDMRDTTIAHAGGDLYGSFPLPRRFGDLSYTAYAGHRSDSIYSGYPYLIHHWGFFLRGLAGLQYGGDLRWNLPVKGATAGISRMNQEITGSGTMLGPFGPSATLLPYQATSQAFWINQYYAEYQRRDLRLDAEYQRNFERIPVLPGSIVSSDTRAWYVAGSYRICKHLELGSYYSRYTNSNVTSGTMAAILPTDTDTSLPRNHVYDKVVAARLDVGRFVYFKVEGHFMDGYGLGTYPDGFYPQQNPNGFDPNTNAVVLKTGFHF